jgi:hypothetical protein
MNVYYTYIYLDPRKPGVYKYELPNTENVTFEYEPFYIGKGKKNRDKHHLYLRSSSKTHNKHLTSKIGKIIKETNQNPIIIRCVDKVTEKETLDLEIKLNKVIGRHDLNTGTLCNHSDGGESNNNKIITEKARSHSGVFKKGQTPWNKGKKLPKHTSEHREKIKLKTSGRIRTENQKINTSRSRGCTAILQYDLEGNFIKEWVYLKECKRQGFTSVEWALKSKTHFGNNYLWFKKIDQNYATKINKYIPTRYSSKKLKK